MIIKGKLIQCKRESKKFGKNQTEEKLFISLAEAEITDEQFALITDAFKDSGKNFTPDWVKDFEGYVNVATKFELPCRDVDKNEYASIEDAIADGLKYMGAEVALCLNIKEGAIYPVSIVFQTEGTAINPFAEFDN